jgi:hypothetical protein
VFLNRVTFLFKKLIVDRKTSFISMNKYNNLKLKSLNYTVRHPSYLAERSESNSIIN